MSLIGLKPLKKGKSFVDSTLIVMGDWKVETYKRYFLLIFKNKGEGIFKVQELEKFKRSTSSEPFVKVGFHSPLKFMKLF